ncbi:MAG: aconitase subunit 2 [Acidimicrobiaceae bacterium]|jgi:predicted aconitase with swiveling domain|nr:aconitase subunit 2 [Acidimicrobiaceae bacterium]|tara:strand:- start:2246 stop:2641 length:396 start_codon:yes stop_codon:yes gene_type:complete
MIFLVNGKANGEVLKLDEPLSFWGGVDPQTGEITDLRHPQGGMSVKGKILMMPFGRGSSSGSSVIAEGIRSGSGPAGIIMMEADEIIALGAIAADEIYGKAMPLIVVEKTEYETYSTGDQIAISDNGITLI